MPVYIPAINEITLLKTWNYFANNMLGPTSMIDSDYACLKFTRKTEMAELSSMNFILRNHTDFQVVDEKELVDLTVKYFQNFYWHVPKQRPNFFNIMFYHNFYKIYSIHQVSKTIFEINEIKEHEQINLGTKCFFLRRASIRRLCSLEQSILY